MNIQERPLGEVIRLENAEELVEDDRSYPIAGVYGFGKGLFKRIPIQGSETSYKKLNKLTPNRLVMSRLKAFEGAISLIPSDFDGWYLSPEFPTFAIDMTQADPRYLANICAWPEFWDRLRGQSKGIGARRERVSAERLLSVSIPLPDLEEQRRIAARLDAALAKFEQVERLRDQRSRLCAALVESMVAHALEQSTQSVRLGDCLVASRTPIEINPDQQYQAFGMRSFGRGTIRYPAAKGSELSKLRYYKFSSDTLALSNIKAWEGAIDIVNEDDTACVASNRFLFYSAKDQRINIRFLKHYLLSRQGLAQVSACSPGSADRNRTLSIKRFEGLWVPLPAREQQDRAATLLDAITEEVRSKKSQETQATLRTSLLNAAFSEGL